MNHASSVLSALYRRKFVILAVFLGAVGTGSFFATRTPTDFVATARILIPSSPILISLSDEAGNVPLGPILPDSDETLRISVMGLLSGGEVQRRMVEKIPGLDEKRVRKNVVGTIGRDSYMELVAYGSTPEEATALANVFAESFEEIMQEHSEEGPRHSLASFERAEPRAWDAYRQANEALTSFLLAIGSSDLERDFSDWSNRRKTIQESLAALDLAHAQRLAEKPVLEALSAARPEFRLTRQEMGLNSAYATALQKVVDKSTELAVAMLTYTDRHPELIRIRKELELAEAQAAGEADLVQSSMTSELDLEAKNLLDRLTQLQIEEAGVDSQRQLLQAEAASLDANLRLVPAHRARFKDLASVVVQRKDYATEISERKAELAFHLEHGIRFTISGPGTRARLEDAKAIPTVLGIYLFSAFAGILLGILLAIVLEMLSVMRMQKPF